MNNPFALLEDGDPGDDIPNMVPDVLPATVQYEEDIVILKNINKLGTRDLIKQLAKRGRSTKGKQPLLRKRLINILKENEINDSLPLIKGWNIPTRYLVCIDFEATCSDTVGFDLQSHEIIEFPAVIIDTRTNAIIDQFHSYVKPFKNSKLSAFCTKLTGITQEMVDNSSSFREVLDEFMKWVEKYYTLDENINSNKVESSLKSTDTNILDNELKTDLKNKTASQGSDETSHTKENEPEMTSISSIGEKKICISTHGPADLEKFLLNTCNINNIPVPDIFRGKYLDMQKHASYLIKNRKLFTPYSKTWTKISTRCLSLVGICQTFKIEFKGRNHSGIDDTTAIANILTNWAKNGCAISLNAKTKY